jgi:hypothetical protein
MDPGDRKYQELHQVRAEWHVFEEYSGSNRFERVMAGAPVAFSLHVSNFGSESRADVGYEGGVTPRVEELPPSCDRVVGERGLRLRVLGASALDDC